MMVIAMVLMLVLLVSNYLWSEVGTDFIVCRISSVHWRSNGRESSQTSKCIFSTEAGP
jgi:hypothetical protein